MCATCGCGSDQVTIDGTAAHGEHDHAHDHHLRVSAETGAGMPDWYDWLTAQGARRDVAA